MNKLIFGDPESIKYKEQHRENTIVDKLKKQIKCPHCGSSVDYAFDINLKEKFIGWNFNCPDNCINSATQFAEGNPECEDAKCYTDLNGKFTEL